MYPVRNILGIRRDRCSRNEKREPQLTMEDVPDEIYYKGVRASHKWLKDRNRGKTK